MSRGMANQLPLHSEAAFKAAWQSFPSDISIFESAHQSGLIADRLSWVFLGAYQSAIRACFDNLPIHDFVSYAASEDRTGEYPGATIDDQSRLQGNKSWIAASKTVDQLLVTVASSNNILLVRADAPGVTLSHRPAPKFLGDMSQGMATFTNVAQAKWSQLQEHRVHDFRLAEPFFVTVTACGYLSTESARLGLHHSPEISKILEELKRQFGAGYTSNLEQFSALYARVKELGIEVGAAAQQAPGTKATDWKLNGRLLAMYQRGLTTGQ